MGIMLRLNFELVCFCVFVGFGCCLLSRISVWLVFKLCRLIVWMLVLLFIMKLLNWLLIWVEFMVIVVDCNRFIVLNELVV